MLERTVVELKPTIQAGISESGHSSGYTMKYATVVCYVEIAVIHTLGDLYKSSGNLKLC